MMTAKVLYTYREAAEILRYPSYGALKTAVSRGKITPFKRTGDKRAQFIHRDEIMNVLRMNQLVGLENMEAIAG